MQDIYKKNFKACQCFFLNEKYRLHQMKPVSSILEHKESEDLFSRKTICKQKTHMDWLIPFYGVCHVKKFAHYMR